MSERSIYLFCTEGGSDKEYHLHLRQVEGGWCVDYANGKRGAVGQSKPKLAGPVSLEAATKEFDKVIKSKMKDGYTESETGVRFTNTDNEQRASGHAQQLPTSIGPEDADRLNQDEDWWAQEKANGERRSVQVRDGQVRGINKLGLFVNIPETWATEMRALGNAMFDGEQVGEHLYVFDLLEVDGRDVRGESFESRYYMLHGLLGGMEHVVPSVRILKAAQTAQEKKALLAGIQAERREGMVYKKRHAPYDGGRSADSLKYKLVESSTCVVLKQNAQRSVQVGLLNAGGDWVPVANVTIPANASIPNPGELVEVEYLYYNPGGAFEQPVYLGPRTDILPAEATLSQVTRLKPGVEMDEQGVRQYERQRA